jgi:hypothetical protein
LVIFSELLYAKFVEKKSGLSSCLKMNEYDFEASEKKYPKGSKLLAKANPGILKQEGEFLNIFFLKHELSHSNFVFKLL